MNREFLFSHISGARIGDPVHIHSYDFREKENHLKLSLDTRVSTDSNGIAESLGLNAQAKVDLKDMIAALEQKLNDKYRLSIV